eukprot:TRINITY_DN5372_c0_g3_i1.p2 TRINITY_DN5372_c0_g3~~TRINITY_DN5372_c0_g3_i1.p2  ORF type:complete len:236 (+),score=26.55 TRINITY_DN5372_c0_g3_i1:266-973(+)
MNEEARMDYASKMNVKASTGELAIAASVMVVGGLVCSVLDDRGSNQQRQPAEPASEEARPSQIAQWNQKLRVVHTNLSAAFESDAAFFSAVLALRSEVVSQTDMNAAVLRRLKARRSALRSAHNATLDRLNTARDQFSSAGSEIAQAAADLGGISAADGQQLSNLLQSAVDSIAELESKADRQRQLLKEVNDLITRGEDLQDEGDQLKDSIESYLSTGDAAQSASRRRVLRVRGS